MLMAVFLDPFSTKQRRKFKMLIEKLGTHNPCTPRSDFTLPK